MAPDWEKIYSLHRYFIWSDRMKLHFDTLLRSSNVNNEDLNFEYNLYMSYWYASLYVVIEGWQGLELSDPSIDELLASPNVDLIRRYRNGAFHYQQNYFDNRFIGLIKDGENVVGWTRALRNEFSRFFLEWYNQQRPTDDQSQPEN